MRWEGEIHRLEGANTTLPSLRVASSEASGVSER